VHDAKHNARSVILLVGTQKGLFRLEAEPARAEWRVEGPLLAGYEINHAVFDPRRPGLAYLAANHVVWGAHVYRSSDWGRHWEPLPQPPHHPSGAFETALRAIWYLAPGPTGSPDTVYAGIDPPGLFVSHDGCKSWLPVESFNHHPTRSTWEPARGGFSVHSIHLDPREPRWIYAAVSAGGAFRSDDGGDSWWPINRGVRAENLPQEHPETGHNIHRLLLHPARPDRLYRQCYNGTYVSDDRGESWTEITAGLPSDFGYALASLQDDPDSLFVIPEKSSHMRATVGGRLRVYCTRDRGLTWQALTGGLPQVHVYVNVLREAMDVDGLDPAGVYFGTSGGQLFVSRDAGANWTMPLGFLPRILSVKAALMP